VKKKREKEEEDNVRKRSEQKLCDKVYDRHCILECGVRTQHMFH
jgi:hypothetical protein